MVQESRHIKDRFTRRSVRGVDLKAVLDHLGEVGREHRADGLVYSTSHFGAEPLHALGPERWLKSDKFVEDTTQAPDVAFVIVGLVLPNLGAGVVGRAGLRVHEPPLGHLGDVEIPELDDPFFG